MAEMDRDLPHKLVSKDGPFVNCAAAPMACCLGKMKIEERKMKLLTN